MKLYSYIIPLIGAGAVTGPVIIDGSLSDRTIYPGMALLVSLLFADIVLMFFDFRKYSKIISNQSVQH
jgi:hypothetical protein